MHMIYSVVNGKIVLSFGLVSILGHFNEVTGVLWMGIRGQGEMVHRFVAELEANRCIVPLSYRLV